MVGVLEVKISRLIELLQEIERERGDIDCFARNESCQIIAAQVDTPAHPHTFSKTRVRVAMIEGE